MIDNEDPRLTAYLLGELDAADHDEIQSALAASADLRQHVDGLRATIDAIHHAVNPHAVGSQKMNTQRRQIDALTSAQQAAIATAAAEPVLRFPNTESAGRLWWRRLAIAALLLYAVGATGIAVWRPSPIQSVVSSDQESAINGREDVAIALTDQRPAVVDAEVIATDKLAESIAASDPVPVTRFGRSDERSVTIGFDGIAGQPSVELSIAHDRLEEQIPDTDRSYRMQEIDGWGFESRLMTDLYGIADTSLPIGEPKDEELWELSTNFDGSDVGMEFYDSLGTTVDSQNEWGTTVNHEWMENLAAQRLPAADGNAPSPDGPTVQLPWFAFGEEFEQPASSESTESPMRSAFSQVDRSKQHSPAATWKPASAATNRARLSIGHHDDLLLAARDTYVRIDGFRARVMFDLYYYNDRPQQLEGQFLLRLPDDAALHYFAFGAANLPPADSAAPAVVQDKDGTVGAQPSSTPATDLISQPATAAVALLRRQTESIGSDLALRAMSPAYQAESNATFGLVKPARFAAKQQAALAYEETVRRRVDPALVEWAGPGIFQTKVFPLMPATLHRIVIGYDVTLSSDAAARVLELDLPEQEAGGRVEFDIAALAGMQATLTPPSDPFLSGGRAYYRYESAAPRDYRVSITGAESVLLEHHAGQGGVAGNGDVYFAAQSIADLPQQQAAVDSRRAVFLLDTSWSDRPDSFSRRLKLMREILANNRDSIDEFAVMMFNVRPYWWKQQWVVNDEQQWSELQSFVDDLALEGATDLRAALAEATSPSWQQEPEESSPAPNLYMISDCIATWGATDMLSISQSLRDRPAELVGGALFAYSFAGSPNDRVMMDLLAETSGGAVFTVGDDAQVSIAATAHRFRPWRMVEAKAEGADEVLVQGGSQSIYPGQALLVAGRGQLTGPIELVLRRGGETLTQVIEPQQRIKSPAASRLYGGVAVDQLQPYDEALDDITVAFSRYFRVPGRSCSLVMLESEADYERLGINTADDEDRLVIASSSVGLLVQEARDAVSRQQADSRTRFMNWIQSLESASLVHVPTALRLALHRMPEDSFEFTARPLNCRAFRISDYRLAYRDELAAESLDFDSVMNEADESLIAYGADDAIKTASSLVEANPADIGTLRSVAFRAIHWNRGDQAAPLLWRIAMARPYQPQSLMLLGRSFASAGAIEESIICYELAAAGKWNARWSSANQIAKVELLSVLAQFDASESPIAGYARARLRQLQDEIATEGMDLAIVMHWNTDRTDVDMHVTEPGGEVCFYKNQATQAGGRMTADITEGLGPEMYTSMTAAEGEYHVQAKYFRSDQNRSKTPTEILVTVMRDLGRASMTSQTKRMVLDGQSDLETVIKLRKATER